MVQIITDTTAGLPKLISTRYHIPVIPQIINFTDQSYYEGVDLDNQTFMRLLKAAKALPKTAAPPPELFVEQFQRLVPLGETILCIHPSSDVSGTVRSAQTAALEFPTADIRVIDTRTIGSSLATLVTLAAEKAAAGESQVPPRPHYLSQRQYRRAVLVPAPQRRPLRKSIGGDGHFANLLLRLPRLS